MMVGRQTSKHENRILVLMPTGRDAELVADTLCDSGMDCRICANADELLDEISLGAGTALLAEEAVDRDMSPRLIRALAGQPVWSDIPVILFSSNNRNAELLLETLGGKINVTIVERPIRITMLISAVRGALRARQRQYQTRDLLRQLEQADEQKDVFLATLSHELRTPLNSILGWIQILRGRELDDAAKKHALEVIERNAHSQADMISDILFVSRIITGKLEIKHEPVDVAEVVERAADMIKPVAESKSIDVVFDTDKYDPAPIEGDAERLQQVILNLLTNAMKFTPEGGRVIIRLERKGSKVVVSVEDNGQGINPQFLPYVFERFRQADSTYVRRIGGLGLGLAIVRHLVELHGGTVVAQSSGKDRGAKFTISLPVADGKQVSSARVEAGTDNYLAEIGERLKGMKALLVEDDPDSRDMLATTLKICGVEIVSVESADEALEKLPEMRPDVLISDIGMPEKDGYDLIRRVRSLKPEEGGETPAIALTGYVSVQDRTLALDAGYQEHLPKPVDTNKLLELLCQMPRNGNGRKERRHAN
jgi:signal transduction histidine kinase/CheY-like chemotaxis protein